jgi:carbonic anhydrase
VVQDAVLVLVVRLVLVWGHNGCGVDMPAMGHVQHVLIDNWLRTVKDTQDYFWQQLAPLDEPARFDRLVELNVIEQVYNLGKTHVVQQAWATRGAPALHGWVFDLRSGFIRALTGAIDGNASIVEVCKFHQAAVGAPA